MEDLISSILTITIRAGTSLLYATLGEIYTERSGVLNLGVEGTMMVGAATAFAVAFHSENIWLGLVAALLVGGLMALIHAFLTISLRADQVVSGLAITLFGTGLASFMGQRLGPGGTTMVGLQGPAFQRIPLPVLGDLPVIGSSVFTQDVLTYFLYLLVPILWFHLYKTRFGLHLRAVGENPQAADVMGVNVTATRYAYTIFGGVLMGLAGAHLSLGYLKGWADNITGGRGWIAIALVIFAMWDPIRAVIGAVLFGGINALQFRMQAAGTTIPASFLNMTPYFFTILVLVMITWWEAVRKRVGAPAALGIPYVREEKR
ncbi:MAG TPA: ABC transporter permease [Anaerolineales bacterium]|nr:ABC transporter permease [Anaerolineales bacterium]